MVSFSTWILTIFMVMFWLFRAVVALCAQFSIDLMGIVPYNINFEIILSFIIIICIALCIKRKMLGSIVYFLLYGTYFGNHLINNIMLIAQGNSGVSMDISMNLICDVMGILLAIFVLLDMIIDKKRKINPVDKKTDWYFKNEKYEKELQQRDDREDKNEYKFF